MNDVTSAAEDYRKLIHKLGGRPTAVRSGGLVARLGVTGPTVTAMLQRLEEAGYVQQVPHHQGVRLTSLGVIRARGAIRRHRLLERAISLRVEQAIARLLKHPSEDPHGHLIPSPRGVLIERQLSSLSSFQPGQRVTIREASDEDPARLCRWKELGLVPGTVLEISEYRLLDVIIVMKGHGEQIILGVGSLDGLKGERVQSYNRTLCIA